MYVSYVLLHLDSTVYILCSVGMNSGLSDDDMYVCPEGNNNKSN